MLDLISNSLAAVIILFIILASQRIPPIPPERVKGVLLIRLELMDAAISADDRAASEPWVYSPEYVVDPNRPGPESGRPHYRLHGSEIQDTMSTSAKFYGRWPGCDSLYEIHGFPRQFSPCAMAYNGESEPNTHYMLFRDPIKDIWKYGLTFVEHRDLDSTEVPQRVKMDLWWMTEEGYCHPPQQIDTLIAPTHWVGWEVNLEEWVRGTFKQPAPIS